MSFFWWWQYRTVLAAETWGTFPLYAWERRSGLQLLWSTNNQRLLRTINSHCVHTDLEWQPNTVLELQLVEGPRRTLWQPSVIFIIMEGVPPGKKKSNYRLCAECVWVPGALAMEAGSCLSAGCRQLKTVCASGSRLAKSVVSKVGDFLAQVLPQKSTSGHSGTAEVDLFCWYCTVLPWSFGHLHKQRDWFGGLWMDPPWGPP